MDYTREKDNWINFQAAFIVLCSVSFLLIKGIGKGDRVIQLAGVLSIIFLLLLHGVYNHEKIIKRHFTVLIIFLLFAVGGSMVMAEIYHSQSLAITAYQQRYVYYYLFYFLLSYYRIHPEVLEKIVIWIAVVHATMFLAQTVAYPARITEAKVFFDRGTLRIMMPGSEFMILGFFYAVSKFFHSKKIIFLGFMFLFLAVMVLLGTRQLLISVILLTLLYILVSKSVTNKFLIFFLFVLMAVGVFFLFRDIFMELIAVTEKSQESRVENIRVTAAKYFLYKFFPNKLTYIFGNGESSVRSPFGIQIEKLKTYYGFYQSDIGLIGVYSKFGALFILGCIVLTIRVLTMKLPSHYQYFKYFLGYVILTAVTKNSVFEGGEGAVVLSIILYIIDYYKTMLQPHQTGIT